MSSNLPARLRGPGTGRVDFRGQRSIAAQIQREPVHVGGVARIRVVEVHRSW